MASPRSQGGKYQKGPQGGFSKKPSKKHFHYSWRHISASVRTENIYVGSEHFQYPLKIIFNAFRNNFGLVIFICEKQTRMRFHYSWRQFFASIKSENISVGLRIIPVPTKMILDSFWNNFRLVNFICEKQPKRYRQLRNIFGFYFWKFQKVSRIILAPSKNYQACAETILT